MVEIPDIRKLVPHSGPMVLLDRIVEIALEGLCAEVTIRADSLFCRENGVGAWVGLEYMAQAIAAHAGYVAHTRGEPAKIGFLLGTRRYVSHRDVFAVGCVLRVHVQCELLASNGVGSFTCRITDSANETNDVATATLTVFQPEDGRAFIAAQGSGVGVINHD